METTTYTIETKFNNSELKVKGVYDGAIFKAETIEPLYEGGSIVIPSFKDLEAHIMETKFKKKNS